MTKSNDIPRVDCTEEPTFPHPGKCTVMFRGRIWIEYYKRMVPVGGLHATPQKAWRFAHDFTK